MKTEQSNHVDPQMGDSILLVKQANDGSESPQDVAVNAKSIPAAGSSVPLLAENTEGSSTDLSSSGTCTEQPASGFTEVRQVMTPGCVSAERPEIGQLLRCKSHNPRLQFLHWTPCCLRNHGQKAGQRMLCIRMLIDM